MSPNGNNPANGRRPRPDVLLDRYLTGDLPPELGATLDAEIAASPELAARVAARREEREAFYAADPPAMFAHRVAVELSVEAEQRAHKKRPWWAILGAPSLATAAVVVVALSYSQLHDPDSEPSPADLVATEAPVAETEAASEESVDAGAEPSAAGSAAAAPIEVADRRPMPEPMSPAKKDSALTGPPRATSGAAGGRAKGAKKPKKIEKSSKPRPKAKPARAAPSVSKARAPSSAGGGASGRSTAKREAKKKEKSKKEQMVEEIIRRREERRKSGPASPPPPPAKKAARAPPPPEPAPAYEPEPESEPPPPDLDMAFDAPSAAADDEADFDPPLAMSDSAPMAGESVSSVTADSAPAEKSVASVPPLGLTAWVEARVGKRWQPVRGRVAAGTVVMVSVKVNQPGYLVAVGWRADGGRTIYVPSGTQVKKGVFRIGATKTLTGEGLERIYVLFARDPFSLSSVLAKVEGLKRPPSNLPFAGAQKKIDLVVE